MMRMTTTINEDDENDDCPICVFDRNELVFNVSSYFKLVLSSSRLWGLDKY